MLQEILTLNIWAFFLVFARVGMALAVMPGFSTAYVSVRTRLGAALMISFVLMPVLASVLPVMPTAVSGVILILLSEGLVGLFFGVVARAIVASLQAAGSFIALFSSLSNALIQDPVAEQQSSIVAGFLTTAGLVLIFVTDTHHLIIRAMAESYGLFEPGVALPLGDMVDYVAHRVADGFELGLRMAAPLALTGLTYYIGLGILGRLMPALPVFFFGLPVQIVLQVMILMTVLPMIFMLFMDNFRGTLTGFFAG